MRLPDWYGYTEFDAVNDNLPEVIRLVRIILTCRMLKRECPSIQMSGGSENQSLEALAKELL